MMVIIISHFEFLGQYSVGSLYNTYFHNPTLGVDYFFILSGFGMMLSFIRKDTYQTTLHPRDLVSYAVRHIKKIYPFYICSLGFGILYSICVGFIDNGLSFIYSIDDVVGRIIPCLFLVQSATGLFSYSQAFCGVFWFLSCLFCIYLVSLPLLCFFKKHINTTMRAVIAFLFLTVSSVVLVYVFIYIQNHSDFDGFVYVSPYCRIFYVACGMILGILFNLRQNNKNNYWEYLAIPLACSYFFLRRYVSVLPCITYSLDIIICSFAVYSLAIGKGVFSKMLSCKLFVYLGNVSMYAFIIHYLIRMYIDYIVNKLHLQSALVALIEMFLIFVGGYGLSILFHNRNLNKTTEITGKIQNP